MKRADTKPRGWHVRRARRPRRISYGGLIAFVAVCEISVLCVLGKRPMPLWVLHAMILAPLVAAAPVSAARAEPDVPAALVWAWSSATSSQGGEG